MRLRQKRSELEIAVSQCVIDFVLAHQPGLRDAIRDLLDKGVTPATIRQRYGARKRRGAYDSKREGVALTVEWLVDEWQRDKGRVKPEESIDRVQ